MKNVQVTLTLDSELATKVRNLAVVKGESFEYMIARLIEIGEKDTTYRTKRNAQKWQEQKGMKAQLEEMKKRLEVAEQK